MSRRTLYGLFGVVFYFGGALFAAGGRFEPPALIAGGLIGMGSAYMARALLWSED